MSPLQQWSLLSKEHDRYQTFDDLDDAMQYVDSLKGELPREPNA